MKENYEAFISHGEDKYQPGTEVAINLEAPQGPVAGKITGFRRYVGENDVFFIVEETRTAHANNGNGEKPKYFFFSEEDKTSGTIRVIKRDIV